MWQTIFQLTRAWKILLKFEISSFKLILVIDSRCISSKIALRWMPQNITNEKSTLVQVMAWCCQTTSHYLSQCWPRFMSPCSVTRPQWVKMNFVERKCFCFDYYVADRCCEASCWQQISIGLGNGLALNCLLMHIYVTRLEWVHCWNVPEVMILSSDHGLYIW